MEEIVDMNPEFAVTCDATFSNSYWRLKQIAITSPWLIVDNIRFNPHITEEIYFLARSRVKFKDLIL